MSRCGSTRTRPKAEHLRRALPRGCRPRIPFQEPASASLAKRQQHRAPTAEGSSLAHATEVPTVLTGEKLDLLGEASRLGAHGGDIALDGGGALRGHRPRAYFRSI